MDEIFVGIINLDEDAYESTLEEQLILLTTQIKEPQNFQEASQHEGWLNVMQHELDFIQNNQT